jgi:hypothetical protein
MGEHLGIGGFVAGGDLNDVVQRHDAAVRHGVENPDPLVFALLVGQNGCQLHALGITFVKPFTEHLGSDFLHVATAGFFAGLAYKARALFCLPLRQPLSSSSRVSFSPRMASQRLSGAHVTKKVCQGV